MSIDLPQNMSSLDLLELLSRVEERLRQSGTTRSGNNPAGDYAEALFCKALNWRQENNSKKGFDAIDFAGKSFQIKSRRLGKPEVPGDRQLSALRGLAEKRFDYLAGLLFHNNYTVCRAALIPHAIVVSNTSSFAAHTNAHIFYLRDNVWKMPGVIDVTRELHTAQMLLSGSKTENVNGSIQRSSPVLSGNTAKTSDNDHVSIQKIQGWANRPRSNVHSIIALVVQHNPIPRGQLVREIVKLKISKNAYGAVASLMINAGNSYGRVFVMNDKGRLSFHPSLKDEIAKHRWILKS